MSKIKVKIKTAFTLVEILIVVCILGIIAAIIAPHYSKATQKAKEATSKEILQTLRTTIERYAIEHNGIPPGYEDNDMSNIPDGLIVRSHLTIQGRYISKMPKNPFNDSSIINVITGTETLSEELTGHPVAGWIYQPETKTIKISKPGVDSEGVKYFDY